MKRQKAHGFGIDKVARIGGEDDDQVTQRSTEVEENDMTDVAGQGQSELTHVDLDVGSDGD